MATIKDFVVKQGISAQTTIVVNGVNVLANDYATHLSARANDYNTYTTLVGFINTVQGNVGAGASGYEANDYTTLLAAYSNDGATLASARSNDYATFLAALSNDYNSYTTLQGEYRSNDYATYLNAQSNDGATLASARANDYSTYTTLQGEFAANDYATYLAAQSNDGVTLGSARANDYNTYTTLQGEYRANDYATYLAALSNDGATLASASANDYNTYTTLQGEYRANDYATYLNAQANDGVTLASARANDYSTYTTLQGEYRANDYATYLNAQANDGVTLASARANDYATYTTLQGEYRSNDYATYLAALSNDGATLGTARANDYATYTAALANDFNSYTTLVGFINTVQDNVSSGGDASNTFVNANDWATYSTLVNEYQANDYATYTALVSEYKANDYATWNGLNGAINIKANSSVNIIAGDGLDGGGALTGNVTLDVDSTVVRTSGNQTINGVKTFGDSIVVQGNLTVNGNVTTVASTNLVVDDRFIELGANTTGLPSADTGIYFNRGASGNSAFYYDQSEGWFALVNSNDPTTNVTVSPTSYSWLKLDTLLVSNTSVVTNLNADRLDSQEGSYYLNFGNATNTNLITLASVTANGATTSSAIAVGGLNVDSGTLYVDSTNNYVGVGTVEPRAKLQVSDVGIHTATLTTTATTAGQVVDSWSATVFRTAKYTVQVHDTVNNYYHASEILIIHNGTTPHLTEYAIVFTDISLATFDADISGGNVRLLITPTNTNNDITVVRHTLTV
jgi:hypothetical protein